MKTVWIYRFAVLLLLFLCLFVLLKLKPIWLPFLRGLQALLLPLIIAYFIAYVLHPIVEKLHEKGVSRTLAILLIYLLVFGLIGWGIYKGYPIILEQMEEIGERSPQFVKMYHHWNGRMERRISRMPLFIHEKIDATILELQRGIENLADNAVSMIKGLGNSLVTIAVIPFIVFYLLKDQELFRQYFWKILPKKWRRETRNLLQEMNYSLGGYVRGQLMICLFLMVVGTVAFWLIRLPYPLLLGIFVGMTDIIPYFGPIIGAVPALFFAATTSVGKIFVVVLIVLLLQFVESNILGPFIVGKSIRIHPLFIIFAVLIGGTVGGILGIFLSVPILVVLKTVVVQVWGIVAKRKGKAV